MFLNRCEDTAPKISVNRNLSLPFDRIREINNFDSRPRNDVAKSLTSLKTTKVSFFDKKERNNCKDFKENIRISSDQEEESSSFLTTLNIAKHNHQLHRKREHSPGHSPNSTISPGNSFIESFGSSSSESHHTEVRIMTRSTRSSISNFWTLICLFKFLITFLQLKVLSAYRQYVKSTNKKLKMLILLRVHENAP